MGIALDSMMFLHNNGFKLYDVFGNSYRTTKANTDRACTQTHWQIQDI